MSKTEGASGCPEARSKAGGIGLLLLALVGMYFDVQNLLGISKKVEARRNNLSPVDSNKLSVRLELQADCFAGVWANHAQRMRNILEPGDIEEALNAASMIGDDNLQRKARGYVVPDSFTHGSSKQRVQWFRQGLNSGDMRQCNTFQ